MVQSYCEFYNTKRGSKVACNQNSYLRQIDRSESLKPRFPKHVYLTEDNSCSNFRLEALKLKQQRLADVLSLAGGQGHWAILDVALKESALFGKSMLPHLQWRRLY